VGKNEKMTQSIFLKRIVKWNQNKESESNTQIRNSINISWNERNIAYKN
jgi:hypothetical protein